MNGIKRRDERRACETLMGDMLFLSGQLCIFTTLYKDSAFFSKILRKSVCYKRMGQVA